MTIKQKVKNSKEKIDKERKRQKNNIKIKCKGQKRSNMIEKNT